MATPPDFTVGQVLTAAQMNAVGLWRVTTCTVSSVGGTAATASNGVITVGNGNTSVTVNNAFSTDFAYYRVHFLLNGSTNGGFARFRVRSAGADIATATYYRWGFSVAYNANLANYNAGAQTQHDIVGQWGSNITSTCWMEIAEPMNSGVRTRWKSETNDVGLGAGYYQQGLVEGNRADDGFTIFTSAGTFTSGTIRIYGYRN